MSELRGGQIGSSWIASGDLSSSQYRPVIFSGNYVMQGTLTGNLAGVLQNKPKNGEFASVVAVGYSKLFCAGSMGEGALWAPGAANAGAVVATSGYFVGGVMLTNVLSGDIGEALVSISKTYATP